MRADPHYVEQLSSRRPDRTETARVAVLPEVPDTAREADVDERRADRVLEQLQGELTSLSAAVGMLSADGSPLARRLGIDLVRAQTWRASWLVRAYALAEGRDRGHFRMRPLASLLEQVRQGLAPECRLAGMTLKVQATDWNASVSVDEKAFIAGIAGAVVATLGVVGPFEGATIRVHVDASSSDVRTVEVSQDEVSAPAAMATRAFDASWAERPGGWQAGLGAQAARAAAQMHGGNATFVAGERRGSALRMSFARSH